MAGAAVVSSAVYLYFYWFVSSLEVHLEMYQSQQEHRTHQACADSKLVA